MSATSPDITSAELAEYARRTAPAPFREGKPFPPQLQDDLWRIANLYTITTENGEAIQFQPTPEQRAVLICIYLRGWRSIILPKARQLGFSTLFSVIAADSVTFISGFQGTLIDKTQADAERKMRGKVLFACDQLPPAFRDSMRELRRTDKLLALRDTSGAETPESTFHAGINYRGGTVSLMWISEWGWIQNHDRARSREIAAGALPAVERAAKGLCVIETTWSGGLDCELGPLVQEALNTPEPDKGPKSWRILFFGWQTCPLYSRTYGHVDPESARYFAKMEAAGVLLSREQKLWYAEKRRTAKSQRTFKEEYPTVVEECWESVPEGSIYGEFIARARAEGRITDFLPDTRWPVDTFWDIGLPINTVAWLVQITPEAIRVLDCLFEEDIQMAERAARLNAKGYTYRLHCFPHDAGIAQTAMPQIAEFTRILGPGCRIVPRTATVQQGIELLQARFPRLIFHRTNCERALDYLGRYRAERETSAGMAKNTPVHDRYSHAADALRQLAQALEARMIPDGHVIGAPVANNTPPPRAMTGFSNGGMARRW
jgi:hypothetical protein